MDAKCRCVEFNPHVRLRAQFVSYFDNNLNKLRHVTWTVDSPAASGCQNKLLSQTLCVKRSVCFLSVVLSASVNPYNIISQNA